MSRRKKRSRKVALAVVIVIAFIAGAACSLLFVYLHPVRVVCLFRALEIPHALPLGT